MRKASSLQFHVELSEGDELQRSTARHRLPPDVRIAALSEPADDVEDSLSLQARAHMATPWQSARRGGWLACGLWAISVLC